jgi:hypothetical protein
LLASTKAVTTVSETTLGISTEQLTTILRAATVEQTTMFLITPQQPVTKEPTTIALSTLAATTSVSAAQQKTAPRTPHLTSTTPALNAPSPTNAPMQGSSIPGREAQNQVTQVAQQLSETLANMPAGEKQEMGYQPSEFLLDCQYAGYSCSPTK